MKLKRIIVLCIAFIMLFILAACGGRDSTDVNTGKGSEISDNNVPDNSNEPNTDNTAENITVNNEEETISDSEEIESESDDTASEEVIIDEIDSEPDDPEVSDEEPVASGIRPEFKEAMDAYEAFYEEYCDFMKKYSENPTDLSLLAEYGEMLTKAAEMDKGFEEWDDDDLTTEELQYYMEVNNRVMQMLVDVMG